MDTLSDDLIYELLCHLPPTTLVRFKLISKAWDKTIQSKSFVNSHLKTTKASKSPNLVLRDFWNHGDLVDYMPDEFYLLDLNSSPPTHDVVFHCLNGQIFGSVDGLVALVGKDLDLESKIEIRIWNPSLRSFIELPPVDFGKDFAPLKQYSLSFGKSSEDYKVVFFPSSKRLSSIYIYSLASNSWNNINREIPVPDKCSLPRVHSSIQTTLLSFLPGAFFEARSSLHWLWQQENLIYLVGFNLDTEVIHVQHLSALEPRTFME